MYFIRVHDLKFRSGGRSTSRSLGSTRGALQGTEYGVRSAEYGSSHRGLTLLIVIAKGPFGASSNGLRSEGNVVVQALSAILRTLALTLEEGVGWRRRRKKNTKRPRFPFIGKLEMSSSLARTQGEMG